jgi:hypothetical protein
MTACMTLSTMEIVTCVWHYSMLFSVMNILTLNNMLFWGAAIGNISTPEKSHVWANHTRIVFNLSLSPPTTLPPPPSLLCLLSITPCHRWPQPYAHTTRPHAAATTFSLTPSIFSDFDPQGPLHHHPNRKSPKLVAATLSSIPCLRWQRRDQPAVPVFGEVSALPP